MPTAPPTRAALLTPAGRSAIATVAVHGPQAAAYADRYFTSFGGKRLAEAEVGRILVGFWKGREEEPGEELVVARTADDMVEIHCHGGVQASRRILRHLEEAGCRPITWQQWPSIQQADPLSAQARHLLPEAPTERAALHLWDQCQGALWREVGQLVALLESDRAAEAASRIERLLQLAPVGLHLARPWSVVLAGPPNVGKSSLLNRLVGYQRAIVLDMPGTTRDVLHATTALEGWPVQFSDTAGIRTSTDPLEEAGIDKARALLAAADCVVVLHDATCLRPGELDHSLRDLPSAIQVVNKIDLADPPQADLQGSLSTSAETGEGVPELIAAIVQHLVPQPPAEGEAIPFLPHHVETLRQTLECLRRRNVPEAASCLRSMSAGS